MRVSQSINHISLLVPPLHDDNDSANIIVAAIWIYNTASVWLLVWGLSVPWKTGAYCVLYKILPPSIYIGFFIVCILLSLAVTICLYVKIFWQAYKQKKQIDSLHRVTGQAQKQDARITRMMALVLGVFLLSWLPYAILSVIHVHAFRKQPPAWLTSSWITSIYVLHANSFMNTIIYGWKNPAFRNAFRKLLCCFESGWDIARRQQPEVP